MKDKEAVMNLIVTWNSADLLRQYVKEVVDITKSQVIENSKYSYKVEEDKIFITGS